MRGLLALAVSATIQVPTLFALAQTSMEKDLTCTVYGSSFVLNDDDFKVIEENSIVKKQTFASSKPEIKTAVCESRMFVRLVRAGKWQPCDRLRYPHVSPAYLGEEELSPFTESINKCHLADITNWLRRSVVPCACLAPAPSVVRPFPALPPCKTKRPAPTEKKAPNDRARGHGVRIGRVGQAVAGTSVAGVVGIAAGLPGPFLGWQNLAALTDTLFASSYVDMLLHRLPFAG